MCIEDIDTSASISFVRQLMAIGHKEPRYDDGLYDIPGYGKGTLAQFSMRCWLRRMDANTAHAVMLANAISAKTRLVKAMGSVMVQLLSDGCLPDDLADVGDYDCPRSGGRSTVRNFLVKECGLTDEDLSKGLETYEGRARAIDRLQYKIQEEMNENEYRQADLQVVLNRAETCSATCSNLLRQFAKPTQNSAAMMKS